MRKFPIHGTRAQGKTQNTLCITKSTELFKLYSKEKTNFFCLIKLLFIKVRCLINVNVKLILKDKGGKQHCLSFVGF